MSRPLFISVGDGKSVHVQLTKGPEDDPGDSLDLFYNVAFVQDKETVAMLKAVRLVKYPVVQNDVFINREGEESVEFGIGPVKFGSCGWYVWDKFLDRVCGAADEAMMKGGQER